MINWASLPKLFMQPLTLRAFDKAQNRILTIFGYEMIKDQICIFGTHYNRFYKPDDIVILRSSGLHDANGEELFEQDVVFNAKEEFVGVVTFTNGAFILEAQKKICLEWPPSSFLRRLDNFLLNPLALEAAVQ